MNDRVVAATSPCYQSKHLGQPPAGTHRLQLDRTCLMGSWAVFGSADYEQWAESAAFNDHGSRCLCCTLLRESFDSR